GPDRRRQGGSQLDVGRDAGALAHVAGLPGVLTAAAVARGILRGFGTVDPEDLVLDFGVGGASALPEHLVVAVRKLIEAWCGGCAVLAVGVSRVGASHHDRAVTGTSSGSTSRRSVPDRR